MNFTYEIQGNGKRASKNLLFQNENLWMQNYILALNCLALTLIFITFKKSFVSSFESVKNKSSDFFGLKVNLIKSYRVDLNFPLTFFLLLFRRDYGKKVPQHWKSSKWRSLNSKEKRECNFSGIDHFSKYFLWIEFPQFWD